MIILGIDPGTLVAGYGVVETTGTGRGTPRLIEYGEIVMSGKTTLAARLRTLHDKLTAVIARTHPDACAIESAFSHKNVRSAMIIGHARGVALLAAAQHQIPVSEYAPREVKRSITGNGAATKEQVQYMVCTVLKIDAPKTLDASDALAVALCHQQRHRTAGTASRTGRATNSWKAFVEANPGRVVKPGKR